MPDKAYVEAPRPILHEGIYNREKFGPIYTFALAPMNECLLDRERRLFLYYATCNAGFEPAAKEIARQTRIDERKVYSIRKALAKKKFISFEEDKSKGDLAIHIRWDNIKTMAAHLREADHQRNPDQNKRGKRSKRSEKDPPAKLAGITNKVRKEAIHRPTIGEINRTMKKRYENPDVPVETADLSDSDLRFIEALENLTEDEASPIIDDWYLGQIPC